MGGGNRKKVIIIKGKQKKKKTKCSHSENRCVFSRLGNATNGSASLSVCGRAFQNLGAE